MKTLLRANTAIPWLPANSQGRLYHTDELPAPATWATAFAFAFLDDNSNARHGHDKGNGRTGHSLMLFTHLVRRGWDIPGGHLEPGETPAQAAIRETLEEAGVLVEPIELVGVQELEVFGPLPRGWTGPIRTQIFYRCRVIEQRHFTPTDEASERGFLDPDAARALPTLANHDLLYEIALERASK